MYEIESGMTNMIEGKLIADSENMTKILLNMGMAWLGSIEFDDIHTHPPMQVTMGVFLDNSKESKKTHEISGTQRKMDYPITECICIRVPCSRVIMYCRNYNETHNFP